MSKRTLRILGMDPSLRNWGLAFGTLYLDDYTITMDHLITVHPDPSELSKSVRKSTKDIERTTSLFNNLLPHLSDVDIVIAETPIGGRDAKAAFGYSVCVTLIGVLNSIGLENQIIEVSPYDVKQVVRDEASKDEMIFWATTQHPEADWKYRTVKGKKVLIKKEAEHVSDAIAAIYAASNKPQFLKLLSKLENQL
jgi:hypothetical protein